MATSRTAPTVGLAMIVRDEAAVVERLARSVLDVVDTWTVVDTGSVDDTPAVLASVFAARPGTVHHRPWVDFGHNRSELLTLAAGTADYLLLLDADMTLDVHGPLPPLVHDAYRIRTEGDLGYWVPRLVRGDRPGRYVGATHEYLDLGPGASTVDLSAWTITHHADGGSRHDKFTRDRDLLQAQLARDPDDPRATFYLAQTLRDLGRHDEAVEQYRRRVELGGWDEEVFYAQLQLGTLLVGTDWPRAVGELVSAWSRRPTRAEPLHELARGHRSRGEHDAALLFAERGLTIGEPDDLLFVHRDVYRWRLRFEHAIAAYWLGDVDGALATNEALLADPDLPDDLAPFVGDNRDWCRASLGLGPPPGPPWRPNLDHLVAGVTIRRLDRPPGLAAGWSATNPSVAPSPDGDLRSVVRIVNYQRSPTGVYRTVDDGPVRTRNLVGPVDTATFDIGALAPVDDHRTGDPVVASPVQGIEDLRPVVLDGRWVGVATVRDHHPGALAEVVLVDDVGADPITTRVLRRADGTPWTGHEKNWMPYVVAGELRVVHTCHPTVVFDVDVATATVRVRSRHDGPAEAVGLRGGSQGIDLDGGHLFVVHGVDDTGGRRYDHRFVWLDATGRIAALTDPFTFVGAPIEFCAGLARVPDATGDTGAGDADLVVSFGTGDRHAWLARVPVAAVSSLLRPV